MQWKIIISAILILLVLLVLIMLARDIGSATMQDTSDASDGWTEQIRDCVDGIGCFSLPEGYGFKDILTLRKTGELA